LLYLLAGTEPSEDVGLEPLLAEAALAMAMLTALPVQMNLSFGAGRQDLGEDRRGEEAAEGEQ
jgi:hypothetical protein